MAGPEVSSPSINNTKLATVKPTDDEPTPTVRMSRQAALVDPTKQGLTSYDKMMLDLEGTVNKCIKQLDKQTQDAQEAKEKNRIMQEQLKKRLDKKKESMAQAVAKGRKAGGGWSNESYLESRAKNMKPISIDHEYVSMPL